jgi:uncharacterized membrane protein YqjE
MWKSVLKSLFKLLLVLFVQNKIVQIKNNPSNNLHTITENVAVMIESRAALFKQNFSDDLQRMVNSLLGYLLVLLALTCSGLTGMLWLIASAWSSPNRNIILGTTMILPLIISIGVFAYVRYTWKKEPLFSRSMQQVETDWLIFRGGLDGTADTSDEANK